MKFIVTWTQDKVVKNTTHVGVKKATVHPTSAALTLDFDPDGTNPNEPRSEVYYTSKSLIRYESFYEENEKI